MRLQAFVPYQRQQLPEPNMIPLQQLPAPIVAMHDQSKITDAVKGEM